MTSASPSDQILSSSANGEEERIGANFRLSDAKSTYRIERNVDQDSIDLVEPKNDLELETKEFSNDAILESAHDITGYDYYGHIRPTKTKFVSDLVDDMSKSDAAFLIPSGEEKRASSRSRSLPMMKPDTVKSDTNATAIDPAFARSGPDNRQSGSDIQDIINGFVKLLNGNVQVQVNTNGPPGKPSFPSRTRINNRGPPRITDVPPIVFDPPVQIPPNLPPATTSTPAPQVIPHAGGRDPPPYPFDVPLSLPPQPANVLRPFVSGVPLPEQLVPTNSTKNLTQSTGEPQKPEKLFNYTASFIEKVNRTQVKVTQSPLSVSPTPTLPSANIERLSSNAKNSTSKPEVKGDKNDTTDESKSVTKMAAENTSATSINPSHPKNSSIYDIGPSTASPVLPVTASVPPVLKPDDTDGFVPSTGVGTAVVVLEPSTQEVSSVQEVHKATTSNLGSTSSTGIISSTIRKRPLVQHSSEFCKCFLHSYDGTSGCPMGITLSFWLQHCSMKEKSGTLVA